MADTAFKTMYREEYIAAFEQGQSLLRSSVTTDGYVEGNQYVFLVAGSGNATATTRGTNGLIPARPDDNQQNTVQMAEWHDLVRKTGFNIYASQGDQRAIMQSTSIKVLNRKIDDDIFDALVTGTVTNNMLETSEATMMDSIQGTIAALGEAEVPWDGRVHAVISPKFLAELMRMDEFASADFVKAQPIPGHDVAWKDTVGWYEWMGVKWIQHPRVPGVGTATEQNFMYHQDSIGHGCYMESLDTAIGYDEEQDYSYARASTYMGSVLLQDSGVVEMTYDATVNFALA